jgi:hypothetical protein
MPFMMGCSTREKVSGFRDTPLNRRGMGQKTWRYVSRDIDILAICALAARWSRKRPSAWNGRASHPIPSHELHNFENRPSYGTEPV